MRFTRRRIVQALAGLAVMCIVLCCASQYTIKQIRCHQMVSAVNSAESVWIEEFRTEDGPVLARSQLNPSQRLALTRILPTIVPGGFPYSLKLCFVPHHRIVAKSHSGADFTLTICFGCDQAEHTGTSLYDMPAAGSAVLRSFIIYCGIRVRNAGEYVTMPRVRSAASYGN